MAKIALVTDTHFGVRSESPVLSEYMGRFWSELFFPYLDEHNIKYVRHLGDIVDRRKYMNFMALRKMRQQFIHPCIERGLDVSVIIGNHDTFHKNTNDINSMNEIFSGLAYDKLRWYSDPTEEEIDGTKILMMPWICSGNYSDCINAINDTKAQVLMGHLEIAGFEMYRGAVTDHGHSAGLFDKFDQVFSGHFHHKSTVGNISYLGAPYEMTWSDYDDDRGFHIFDTDTRELTYIKNPFRLFHKFWYNDAGKKLEDVMGIDTEALRDTYVKVIVTEKTNPYWFDMYVDKIEKSGIADLQIVDDHLNLSLEDDEEVIDEAEDTLTSIKKFAASYLQDKDPQLLVELNSVLGNLYNEALQMESDA